MISALFIIASAVWMHSSIELNFDLKLIVSSICFGIGACIGMFEFFSTIYIIFNGATKSCIGY